VQREQPRIGKLVRKFATQLTSLSDVSQKQAVAQITLSFILAYYPDDEEGALALSGAMREQVDMHIREMFSHRQEH
jgi:hypothetical protein